MNQNFFYKCGISSLTASFFLFLWFLFDINISKISSIEFDIQNEKIAPYFLVFLILLCAILNFIEYSKNNVNSWQLKLQFFIFIVLPLISLIIFYPKLIEDTLLQKTKRLDLIIPILSSILTSIAALQINIEINTMIAFYKFRKTILPIQIVRLIFLCFLAILGIVLITMFSGEEDTIVFPIRYLIFAIMFLIFFIALAPKKKIFSEEKLAKLEKISAHLDRRVETSEYISSLRKPFSFPERKVHKKTMTSINRSYEERIKSTFPRFITLKEIAFKDAGAHFVPIIEGANDNEPVIRVNIIQKDTQEVLKSVDVNYKYVKMACAKVPKLVPGNDVTGFLTSMATKAYSIHLFYESDPNELMLNFAFSDTEISNLKKLFNNRNPNINYVASDGWSALLTSVANGAEKNTKYLLQKAADPNLATKHGATPLHFAAMYGKFFLCKLLLQYQADVNQRDIYGSTALMLASMHGHNSIVKLLIQCGADSQLVDNMKKTALTYATEGNYGEICKHLKK